MLAGSELAPLVAPSWIRDLLADVQALAAEDSEDVVLTDEADALPRGDKGEVSRLTLRQE